MVIVAYVQGLIQEGGRASQANDQSSKIAFKFIADLRFSLNIGIVQNSSDFASCERAFLS